MNNFKVITYYNLNEFFKSDEGKNIKKDKYSIHIVPTTSLSMWLKKNQFDTRFNYVWTYGNVQRAIYRKWYAAIENENMKVLIREILDNICSDKNIYNNLINDINNVLSDYKYYIMCGIRKLKDTDKVEFDKSFNMIRQAFNDFSSSPLVKDIFDKYDSFTIQQMILRLNTYYKRIINKEVKVEEIWCIKTIYFYNLTFIDGPRFRFFHKLSNMGIKIVFVIPYGGFLRPWENTYKFIDKRNWTINKTSIPDNRYIDYLNAKRLNPSYDENRSNIKFKKYIDPYEFKFQLKQRPLSQKNKPYKTLVEYVTFSYDLYKSIFNGVVLDYKDRTTNIFYFNKGNFLKGLYNCKWDEEKKHILMEYKDYINCIVSGWIEIKSGDNVISGEQAISILIDLEPYMAKVNDIDEILQRLYKVNSMQEFSSIFYNLSKEKTTGDKVKEYLHNPLKVLPYVDNNRYEITIKQLIELTKKLKRCVEDLIPKDNKINLYEHKNKLIRYWESISYIPSLNKRIGELYKNKANLTQEDKDFLKSNLQNMYFTNKLNKIEKTNQLYTIQETKEYMNIILSLGKRNDDTGNNGFNYIKTFDQIEGILLNDKIKNIYVTDLSEKSLSKYVTQMNKKLQYFDEDVFFNDINILKNEYGEEGINVIVKQHKILKEENINFIKYYIGALISFSKAQIEFSWIDGINKNDTESSLYRILLNLYGGSSNATYINNKEEILSRYDEIKDKLSFGDINKDVNKSIHLDIAPMAWIDLDFCPKKFFYSGILNFYPVYESEFHQRMVFSVLGKLLSSQNDDMKGLKETFYPLFPQWNETMKDNFIDTEYKKDIREVFRFKNIYFPYYMKYLQILKSKHSSEGYRRGNNAYLSKSINSEKFLKEFLKTSITKDDVEFRSGQQCYMCPYSMICCKGEFSIDKREY